MRFLFLVIAVLVIFTIGTHVWQSQLALWFGVASIIACIIGFVISRQSAEQRKEALGISTTENKINTTTEPVSQRVLLTAMMSSMREGVIIVGSEMRVIGSNPAAADIFGHVAPPLEARRLTELTRNLNIHQAFQSAIQTGEHNQINFESRGDEKRIFDLRVAPLHFEDGTSPSAIGVFYDITQLEKLETVRQEFLSNVSHELRTPLTSILAYVEMLEDSAINDAENNLRFLTVIRKNAQRMSRLISDILELSAIEAGKIEILPLQILLAPIVEEIIANLAAKAKTKQIVVEHKITSETVVFADAIRLEQMLTNLIDNAIKFNSAGRVTISFETSAERDRILVRDTGEGILPEHTERIFERFYRVDRARSRDAEGTGLGLAIVKHLVKLHGGEVSVVSTFGEGSTFTIELPKK